MSSLDVGLYAIIGVIGGGLVIWFLIYTFSGQSRAPSNLTVETLKKGLVDSTGFATSDITESTGTVLVNSEEFSARTSRESIQKGTLVRVIGTDGLILVVEKA